MREGRKGFKVYVAGGMGLNPEVGHLLHEFIPAEDVYLVAAAIKRLFSKHGNRQNRNAARLRYLWKSLGESRFRELYQEEVDRLRQENAAPLQLREIPQREIAMSLPPAHNDSPEYLLWKRRYVEPQKQEGLYSVLVPAFLGNLTAEEVLLLAQFLAPFGQDVVRATFGQNLRLRNLPAAYLPNAFSVVRKLGALSGGPRLLSNSISCTGADTCRLGICRSKGALKAIAQKLSQSGLDLDRAPEIVLNISGCPRACGQHLLADLGFYGVVGNKERQNYPAYTVVAGALYADGQARLARRLRPRGRPRSAQFCCRRAEVLSGEEISLSFVCRLR